MDLGSPEPRARLGATLVGAGALALWATLASLTAFATRIPPFELVALGFGVGGGAAAIILLARGRLGAALRQPAAAWAVRIGGLFGYHFFYFVGLRLAPAAAANLVNYLWPLLIVLFSAFLPGERLRLHHVIGAAVGFAGVAVLVLDGGAAGFAPDHLAGYAAAFAAGLIWAVYSVLTRRMRGVPTEAVAGFCLATAALAALCHVALETTVIPTAAEALVVLVLGLEPVGLAFFLWDHGVKEGDIRLLGIFAYATPLVSTALLVVFGLAAPSLALALAVVLVIAGAMIGTGTVRRRNRSG
ncbi:MAG: EamA family transporter [Alphaproteobacteria bacterium]|nr:EamA family transporter [Alphaproteobacteria bacterium]